MSQNYPNSFNPITNFEFQISNFEFVRLSIFDILGREVAVLVNEEKQAGTYKATWDTSRLPSGVYFYRLNALQKDGGQAGELVETKKMVLLR